MKNCTKRWLYLLAGSALSAKEVKEVCAWLASGSPDEIVALVMQLRRQELSTPLVVEGADVAASEPTRSAGKSLKQDTVAEISRVLRTDSRLSAREAAERLAVELEKELRLQSRSAPDIPRYSKESFDTYVGKLLNRTSPQILLHLAHRIRDSAIGRPVPVWPLRSGET